MKYISNVFAFVLLLQLNISQAQTGEICNWDSDKQAAVVLTFDDWSPGHFPIVVPELKKRNMLATFYPMISSIKSWPNIQKAVSNGNEMGNHSQSHPALTGQPADEMGTEIRGAKEIIDKNLSTQTVLTFDYPYGAYNDHVIDTVINTGHIAARGVNTPDNYTYNFAPTNRDYYRLKSYGMNTGTTTTEFYNQISKVISGGGLLVYMYHSVDDAKETYNDNWYAKVWQDSLIKQLDTLASFSDKIWVTTLAQAVKYHREANCATLTKIQAYNGEEIILNLTDTLSDNNIYNQPLSIKLKKNGIKFSKIMQNGKHITIDADYNDTIQFKAIPDNGEIVLKGLH